MSITNNARRAIIKVEKIPKYRVFSEPIELQFYTTTGSDEILTQIARQIFQSKVRMIGYGGDERVVKALTYYPT